MTDNERQLCEEMRDIMYSFLVGELTDGESRELLRHVAECPPCAEALRQHAKLFGLLRSIDWDKPA
ncbi:MAG TPA: zf-HC2 domain-containing protein [Fimbriimonadales bacterium]|nr:zf-HC2 domain-containing protein [Fimbriimonadales bacterium]